MLFYCGGGISERDGRGKRVKTNQDNILYRDWRKTYPVIERGEGVYLLDRQGKKYIDASGGPFVVNIGHGVTEVIEAMEQQARKVCFPYAGNFSSEAQIELADEVIRFAPAGMSRVYFVSGGSEANEVALKIARQYHLDRGEPSRVKIIGRWQGYHGGTLGALSMGGHTHYRQDYLPYMLDFPHIHAPYCYRCRFDREYPSCGILCAHELERAIIDEGKESIAAFISEPVTGSSLGAMAPPLEYFPIIREICDRHGILLIVDEVITGFGRTGKNFGIDHWGVVPDLIVTGKGISSGYTPLGATIIHEKIFEVFSKSRRSTFFLGYTYGGNPLSCAAGLAVLRYIKKNGLVERADKMGEYLFGKFESLKKIPIVGDIRGKGLLLGIELVQDGKKTPFPRSKKLAEAIVRKAFENGLILLPGHGLQDGVVGDLLMIAPPFIVQQQEIDEIYRILEDLVREAA
jgi:adenosylmethionine-8-amino-7-oxononanoate aminotransferase